MVIIQFAHVPSKNSIFRFEKTWWRKNPGATFSQEVNGKKKRMFSDFTYVGVYRSSLPKNSKHLIIRNG